MTEELKISTLNTMMNSNREDRILAYSIYETLSLEDKQRLYLMRPIVVRISLTKFEYWNKCIEQLIQIYDY